ncbi:malate dehydrogenase [Thermoplasmatales archaeon SW_10_69_26]|nr:MAG: malate dehydrogenase [Thermoplasmatales archaeon SW_10_69_26]
MTKLGFVGAGQVGATAAFSCLHQLDVDEIAIVDIQEDLAEGQSLDLAAAAAGLGEVPEVNAGGDYELLDGADVVVSTAGSPRKPGMDRLDLLEKNVGITRNVVEDTFAHAPGAHLLMVANPVDVLTYAAWTISDLPRNRVFGMGSWHDSLRLRFVLSDEGYGTDAFMLGEHGESMLVAKSAADVGDTEPDWADIQDKICGLAMNIIEKKDYTNWAPGVATANMVKAIVENEKRVLPTSTVLQGEYGIEGASLGVPAVLGQNGLERVLEYDLADEDRQQLQDSADKLKKQIGELDL